MSLWFVRHRQPVAGLGEGKPEVCGTGRAEGSSYAQSVAGVVDYTLDPVGNRLNRASNLPGVVAAASSFDANDRLLSDTSDDNGNTLSSEKGTDEYDFENRLLKRTKPDGTVVTLVYNADGDRMSKTVAATNGVTVVTRFLNDRNNPTGYSQVLEELDAAGNVLAVNTFGHDLIAREAGSDVRYYVYDGHGSVRALTDASGIETDRYDYDAFGLLIQRQALNPLTGLLEDVPTTFTGFPIAPSAFTLQPYLYCGEFFDHDLGMVFLRARYMDPERGRFWTMDDFEGFHTDPVSLHKYLYANADAVNGVDPTGYFSLLELVKTWTFRGMLIGALFAVSITAWLNPDADWSDYLIAVLAGGLGGAIGVKYPKAGAFLAAFLMSSINARKQGCSFSDSIKIGLIAGGLALVATAVVEYTLALLNLEFVATSPVFDFYVLGISSGFFAGLLGTAYDQVINLDICGKKIHEDVYTVEKYLNKKIPGGI